MPTPSTYEIRVTVVDREHGRARSAAKAELTDLILRRGARRSTSDVLNAHGFSLEHVPEIAEVIDP